MQTPQATPDSPPAVAPVNTPHRALVPVLAALSALAPLSIDMYVPAFPTMARSLAASAASIQLSMTACLIGIVVGQLVMGPVSDRIGRRTPLLAGITAFILFSLLTAAAPNVGLLVAARFLQGFAGAVPMVVARAVLTDHFEGGRLAKAYSVLIMVIGVAPVIAPVLGAAVLRVAPWGMIFVLLAFLAALAFVATHAVVDESHHAHNRSTGGFAAALVPMRELLATRRFLAMVLMLSAASAGMFAYIAGSTFVFQEHYGMSPSGYSLVFAVNSFAVIISSMVFGRLSATHPLERLLPLGIVVSVLGALVQVLVDVFVGDSMAVTWVCLFVTQLGLAWIIGSTMTLGQTIAQRASGSGSALLGAGQFILGAVVAPVVGLFGTTSPLPMAVMMLVAYGICLLVWATLARTPRAASPGA